MPSVVQYFAGAVCALAVALAMIVGGSLMVAAGAGDYPEIDLWFSIPVCPTTPPYESSSSPLEKKAPNLTDYAAMPFTSYGASSSQYCGNPTTATATTFVTVPKKLFAADKPYYAVLYMAGSTRLNRMKFSLFDDTTSTTLFRMDTANLNSTSSASRRRLLKGSSSGSSGSASTSTGGRGAGSSRSSGRSTYIYYSSSGTSRTATVKYRKADNRADFVSWDGAVQTSYGRRKAGAVAKDSVVFAHSPSYIAARNDYSTTTKEYRTSADGTTTTLTTKCMKPEDGCEVVTLHSMSRLGFGTQDPATPATCRAFDNVCTTFQSPAKTVTSTDTYTVMVEALNVTKTAQLDGVETWPSVFITFQSQTTDFPNGAQAGGGIALIVIGSILFCGGCFAGCVSGNILKEQHESSSNRGGGGGISGGGLSRNDSLVMSIPRPSSGHPLNNSALPSAALPEHLLCTSNVHMARGGDLPNLASPSLPRSATVLDLYGNSVRTFAGGSEFSSLGGLQLGNTDVTSLAMLSSIPSLIWLDVTSTEVSSLTSGSNANLVWMNATDCNVSALTIGSFPSLRCLVLCNNAITSIDGSSLAANAPNLAVLDLSNNDLSNLAGIEACTSLLELDLSSNDLTDISALSDLVANAPNLRYINIKNNNLTRRAVGPLLEKVKQVRPECVIDQDTIVAKVTAV